MLDHKTGAEAHPGERIDIKYDYGLCTWARHFNVSESRVKEAVAAVGSRVEHVRQHLNTSAPSRSSGQDRLSTN